MFFTLFSFSCGLLAAETMSENKSGRVTGKEDHCRRSIISIGHALKITEAAHYSRL